MPMRPIAVEAHFRPFGISTGSCGDDTRRLAGYEGRVRRDFPQLSGLLIPGPAYEAVAVFLLTWKHSRQNTGRPWVGLNGTVVSFPQFEQTVRVSTFG